MGFYADDWEYYGEPFKKLTEQMHVPVICCPGNHDVWMKDKTRQGRVKSRSKSLYEKYLGKADQIAREPVKNQPAGNIPEEKQEHQGHQEHYFLLRGVGRGRGAHPLQQELRCLT